MRSLAIDVEDLLARYLQIAIGQYLLDNRADLRDHMPGTAGRTIVAGTAAKSQTGGLVQ
jgi:hypothetical protein